MSIISILMFTQLNNRQTRMMNMITSTTMIDKIQSFEE